MSVHSEAAAGTEEAEGAGGTAARTAANSIGCMVFPPDRRYQREIREIIPGMNWNRQPLAAAIVLALACGGSRSPTETRAAGSLSTMRSGSWGGPHVSLTTADSGGATLDFDCAHGSITGPLSLAADGSFRLSGTYVREHGGPIRIGETPDSQDATYSGTVRG